ncbi:integrase family protein [Methylobacterium sp. J-059]|uniref:tyrosine-type recombinase/integrase n=1 Tax=Methylobacterium sp. J-059 TaxID=2836643 RepID=UPI001FB9C585|nr:integrase family protein [Methylobacterium sp. J-059]MCJ2040840.1 integrase family protein [Methylobacterium sp. J-059]
MPITEAHVKTARKPLPAGAKAYDVNDGKTGLVLRVGRRGAVWAWRTEVATKTIRLTLGSVDFLTLTQARKLAGAAMEQVRDRNSQVDDRWLQREFVRTGMVEPPPPVEEKRETVAEISARLDADGRWTFAEARDRFLDEVKRTRREATWVDYRKMLTVAELKPFEHQKAWTLDLGTMARVVAAMHRTGRERHAEHLASVIRPMWTFLALEENQRETAVKPGIMAALKPPERSRRENEDEDDDGPGSYVPPVAEVGRILAIAQAGILHPVVAAAVELMVLTAQRRRTIVSARRRDFAIEDGVMVWRIPPAFRKTARKRGDNRTHDLPLAGAARAAVERMLEMPTDSRWLFPGLRPQKAGDEVSHVNESVLNHAVRIMPGVDASPHDLRRAITTHGQEDLGFTLAEVKLILDHNEGHASDDVTESAYSRARRLAKKSAVLDPWREHVEQAAAAAVLPDREALHAVMTEARKPKASKPAPEIRSA